MVNNFSTFLSLIICIIFHHPCFNYYLSYTLNISHANDIQLGLFFSGGSQDIEDQEKAFQKAKAKQADSSMDPFKDG